MTFGQTVIDKLSKGAAAEAAKLEAKLQAVIAADRVREPKLTPDEVAEVEALQNRMSELKPRIPEFETQLKEKESRLRELERLSVNMILSGADPAALVDERIRLEQLVPLLSDVLYAVILEHDSNGNRVERIKNAAREREVAREQ